VSIAPAAFDYVTVGHVTVDVLDADGSRRPGGGAFYSALQAARLGLRTLIVTKGVPTELRELLAPFEGELEVMVLPSDQTTTLLTSGSGAQRRQRVLAWAGPIDEDIELDAGILHLAPVARETPARWRGRARFVGLTPQGLVRTWNAEGEISLVALERDSLPEHFDAVVISQVELASCAWLLPPVLAATTPAVDSHQARVAGSPPAASERSPMIAAQSPRVAERPLVVVTAGGEPITIHSPTGSTLHPPALPIEHPRDDIGAGDVFAAACFIALVEGLPTPAAIAYGNAAAAVRLEGVGAAAVGDRRAVLERLGRPRDTKSKRYD
jgi:hypothetical protein